MKIKFIGTGSIGAKERSSSYLIDDKILIDCGNGIVKTLHENNVDFNKISTVLITHLHGDHFLDLPFLILQKLYLNATNNLKIYCPTGTEAKVKEIIEITFNVDDWTQKRDLANVEFIEFDNLDNYSLLDDYNVTSYEVVHSDKINCYGFILSNNDKKIGFSGDSSYCDSINKIVENSDISILDTTFINGNDKHMGVDNIINIIEKYNKKVISTHMDDNTREYILENNIENVIVPKDLEEIIL